MGQYGLLRVGMIVFVIISGGCLQPFNGVNQEGTELGSHAVTVEKEMNSTLPNNIIYFGEMTERQQRTFTRALNGSYNTVRIPLGVDYDIWYDHEYVQYQNKTYSVVVSAP